MAATKMLTQLLRADTIAYTIRTVSNFDEVKIVVKTYLTSDIKSVFLLNCGAVRFQCYCILVLFLIVIVVTDI
jgi:hypothetical protein